MSTEKPPKNPLALEATNAIQDADQLQNGQSVYLKANDGSAHKCIVTIDPSKPYVLQEIEIMDGKNVIWQGSRHALNAQIKEGSLVLLQQNPEAVAQIQRLTSETFHALAAHGFGPTGTKQSEVPALLMAFGPILHPFDSIMHYTNARHPGLYFWRSPDGTFQPVSVQSNLAGSNTNKFHHTVLTQSGETLVSQGTFEDIRHHLYYLNLNEIGSAIQLITNATRAQAENNNALSSPSS